MPSFAALASAAPSLPELRDTLLKTPAATITLPCGTRVTASTAAAVIAAVAEYQRERHVAATRAGMRESRGGRPRRVQPEDVADLLSAGLSVREIATRLGCHPATVYRALKVRPNNEGY